MLDTGGNRVVNAALVEFFSDRLFDALQEFLVFAALLCQTVDNLLITDRIQMLEREILELPLDALHAQTVRNRRIDFHGLQRFGALFCLAHELDRPHVVQTVGQLDQDDADVLRHRDEHLAQILHLLLLFGIPDLTQSGDAVYQIGYGCSELLCNLVVAERGIFNTIVQKSGTD